MDEGLRPRDIQARIRAGQSSEQIAAASGMPLDKVSRFEAPVLAERAHIADRARLTEVRHSDPGRTVDDVVRDAVRDRGIDIETIVWDSWRRDDGRWTVEVVYGADGSTTAGLFTYDLVARAVFPDDEVTRSLLDPTAPEPSDDRPRLVPVPTYTPPDEVFDHSAVSDDTVEADEDATPIVVAPAAESSPTPPSTLTPPSTPSPTRAKPARGKRATVPSWDEILFGGSDSE